MHACVRCGAQHDVTVRLMCGFLLQVTRHQNWHILLNAMAVSVDGNEGYFGSNLPSSPGAVVKMFCSDQYLPPNVDDIKQTITDFVGVK